MKRYGRRKRFKKTFRRGYKASRKAYRRTGRRRFGRKRRIGRMPPEIKQRTLLLHNADYITRGISDSTHIFWTQALVNLWPAAGVAVNEKIGDQIFVRYIRFFISGYEDNSDYYTANKFRIVVTKARTISSVHTIDYFNQSFVTADGTMNLIAPPIADQPPLIYDKVFKVSNDLVAGGGARPNDLQNIFQWKKSFKVMKMYQKQGNLTGFFNHADYFIGVLAGTNTADHGTPTLSMAITVTYTDE